MEQQKKFDLVVVGGGTAGTITAIAAAREGLNVAVCEKNTFLGGLSTGSGLAEMNAASFKGKKIYGGIEEEIFDKLVDMHAGAFNYNIPMSSNPNVKVDRFRYNPEILKIVLEQMAVDAGIFIYYDCFFEKAVEDDNFTITFNKGAEKYSLQSKFLVDATSNCEVVDSLKYETIKSDRKKMHTSSLIFRLSNVDTEKLQKFILGNSLNKVIDKGYEKGILKGRILGFSPIPYTNDVSVNVTKANVDFNDIDELSAGIIDTRNQIIPIVNFIKSEVPGIEKSYISNIAPIFGIRDSRKVVGEYTFTLEDLEKMVKFDDRVAVGCYPMDIHDPVTNSVIWEELPGVYYIPFRALLPKKSKKLLVVGKSISADMKAFAASRVMPIVFNVGESAGYLIAYAAKHDIALNDLNPKDINTVLLKKGINLF